MGGGLGIFEYVVIAAVSLLLFVGVPLGIYLLVRKAAADGASDAAQRKERS
jgi:hypothetical protein